MVIWTWTRKEQTGRSISAQVGIYSERHLAAIIHEAETFYKKLSHHLQSQAILEVKCDLSPQSTFNT